MTKQLSFGALFLGSLFALLAFTAPHAFAATATWDGEGSDTNMQTAENWAGDTAPVADDDLIFPANVTNRTVVNDFTAGTAFNSVTFSGTASSASSYDISGNALEITAGITDSMTGTSSPHAISAPIDFSSSQSISIVTGAYLDLSGVVSGSGNLTKSGGGNLTIEGNNTFTGTFTISAGGVSSFHVNAFGNTSAATSVASGAFLYICYYDADITVAEPLNLTGNGTDVTLYVSSCSGGGTVNKLATFSGALTLGSNVLLGGTNGNDGKFTGAITGSYSLALKAGQDAGWEIASSANGSLTANGVLASSIEQTTYASNSPSTPITVSSGQTGIVTGTYGAVTINSGGTLKGTGTVSDILMSGGHLAPGLSPGCITTGNTTFSGGNYDVEIGGTTACTGYDALTVTGTVSLGTTTALNVSHFGGFTPAAGNTFMIIDNDVADALTGTFQGLAEGATFTVAGIVYRISYVGGTGNDVVLTVQSVPTTPDTGFMLLSNNPAITFGITIAAAFGILIIGRRYATAKSKMRK